MKSLPHVFRARTCIAIAALAGLFLMAQPGRAQEFDITSFTISAAPNPATSAQTLTFTANIEGESQTPTGTIQFFLGNSTLCETAGNGVIYIPVGAPANIDEGGNARLTYPVSSLMPGQFEVCATYSGDPYYGGETTSPAQEVLTIYGTTLNVTGPTTAQQNQTLNFMATVVSNPAGGPTPTGTVTLNDESSGNSYPALLTNGAATITIPSLPPGSHSYYVYYGGNANYAGGSTYYGEIFIQAGLLAVAPAVAVTGSPDTTVTLTGEGFTNASQAQLTLPNANVVALNTTFLSATKLRAVIPAAELAAAAQDTLSVVTGGSTSNTIPFTIYTPFIDTVSANSTPATLTYGQTGPLTLSAGVARGVATDGAVPTGAITFSIDGTPVTGAGQLAQVTTAGSYQPGPPVAADSNPNKLLSADFNSDGLADLVGYNQNNGYFLQLFLSAGPNAFQTESRIYTGCQPQDFAVGDINNDGFPDLVVACANQTAPGPYAMYVLANGDGTFQAPQGIANSTIVAPTQIAIGDFNGDGALDVVMIDANGDIQRFSGSAPFTGFTAQTATAFPVTAGAPANAIAADFNQDGRSDLAVFEFTPNFNYNGTGSGAVLVLTSNADGTFAAPAQPPAFTSPAFYPQAMTVADVNGDGFPDVAVVDPGEDGNNDTGNVLIYENNGVGQLSAGFSYAAAGATSVAGAPFPVIGKPTAAVPPAWSLVYTAQATDVQAVSVTALQRQSATAYTVAYTIPNIGYAPYMDGGEESLPLVVGDWNGDGYLDLAVNANATEESYQAQIKPAFYGNDAAATLASTLPLLTGGAHTLIAAYPGDPNFAAGNSYVSPITVYPALPSPGLSGPATATAGQTVTFAATVAGVAGAAAPTGTVQLYDEDDTPLGPAQVLTPGAGISTAQISTAAIPSGAHDIFIVYGGDANYLGAPSANIPITINLQNITLNLASSAATVTAGSMVEFDLQTTGGQIPAGETITFTGLPTPSAVTTVTPAGAAAYRFGMFAPGQYTIQAQYGGDATFAAMSSNTITLNVTPTPVTLSLTSSANPVTYPNTFNLTATATSAGYGIPTGTVAFDNNGAALGNGTLAIINGASGFSATPTSTLDTLLQGGQNIAVASGDFNKDGKLDLAVLQSDPTGAITLNVSLGNGDGTFAAPVIYGSDQGVSQFATSLIVGDFNKDGYSDLATTGEDGYITVFLAAADGSGNLQVSQNIETTSEAQYIATGDFNGDGNPDLAAVGTDYVSVYLGAGGGGNGTVFPAAASFQLEGYFSPSGMVAADFNKDGYSDLAISNSDGSTVTVLLYNTDAGNFTAQSYPAGASATAIAAGDFNGDSYPDLAVVSSSDSTVDILLNNQQGGFQAGISYATAGTPTAIVSGDFNGDGFADFAIAGNGSAMGGTSILYGAAVTGAATATKSGETLIPGAYGLALTAADFNGDGNPDLAVALGSVAAYLDGSTQLVLNNVALAAAGTYPLTAVYTPATGTPFAAATSNTVNEVVQVPGGLSLVSIDPASGYLGSGDTPITLTGTGFVVGSAVLLNGTALTSTFVSATELQATIPAAFFATVQSGAITVTNPGNPQPTAALTFSVLPPAVQVVLTGPATAPPATQPTINFQLPIAYPAAITGTFTLTVTPATPGGLVDPAVQFVTGGDTLTFTLPANSTVTPPVQLQTGTLSGTITVTLTLQAAGIDITPASLQPVVVQVPPSAPTISSLTVARNGTSLTVTMQGFSNTRDMKSAVFNFTAASGATINNPTVTVDLSPSFVTWYGETASDQYGSAFTYVQTFLLTDDASTIGSVSATLINSVGTSNSRTGQ